MTLECQDRDKESHVCRGEVSEGRSKSGASVYVKCEAGWDEYEDFSQKLHADISSRYPGYDIPGSVPPAWFDAANAGEEW
jgi:hypothetical protein